MDKDIVIFDIESTGIDPNVDKMVSIAMMKATSSLERKTSTYVQIFNPEIPIPKEASDIHKITDDMVKDKPLFKDKAAGIVKFIGDCDLGTYNGNKFDIPLLITELSRCGIDFSVAGRRLIDACIVFHEKEKRDLTAALKLYCNKEMENAHEASADVDATFDVLKGQIERYDDVSSVEDLNILSGSETRVDVAGFLEKKDGSVVFKVGKHKGTTVKEAHAKDAGYFQWLYKNAPSDTRNIVTKLLS